MQSDTLLFKSVNINLVYPLNDTSGFRKFIRLQDEAFNPTDSTKADTQTIFQSVVVKPNTYKKSIFSTSYVNKKIEAPVKLFNYNTDWFAYVVITCLIVYALIKKTFYNKHRIILTSFFNYRYTNILFREGHLYNESGFFVLLALAMPTSVLLFFNWLSFYFSANIALMNSFHIYLKILILFVIFYLGKIIIMKILAIVFKLNKMFSEFVLLQHIFLIVLGIFGISSSILLFYSSSSFLVLATIIFFIALFFNYIFRLFKSLSDTSFFSVFYFFLYICSVEIIPLLVVYKLLNK